MTALNIATVAHELDRLGQIFTRPSYMPKDARTMASLYLEILDGYPPVSAEQLTAAVSAYRAADEKFFPKPGALRSLARLQRVAAASVSDSLTTQYEAWERLGDDAISGRVPCPVCGERWQTQPTGRWECWHDETAHAKGNGYYVGRPLRDPLRRKHQPDALLCFQFAGGE